MGKGKLGMISSAVQAEEARTNLFKSSVGEFEDIDDTDESSDIIDNR